MNSMKLMLLALPALVVAGVSAAQARDVYCNFKGGGSPDRIRDWYVVNENVRKPQPPEMKVPSGCRVDFQSVGGMNRPIEIVTKPKFGETKTSHNALYYRSWRTGEDFVAVRLYESGRTGTPESHVIQYRIHVVDRPL